MPCIGQILRSDILVTPTVHKFPFPEKHTVAYPVDQSTLHVVDPFVPVQKYLYLLENGNNNVVEPFVRTL